MVWDYQFEPADVTIVLTLVLLEGVLSFDNAAILAAMVRRLPEHLRRRALLYGLAGAYTFRILAILGVTFIVQYPVLKALGGAYLVYLAVKHLRPKARAHTTHAEFTLLGRLGLSPLWQVVIGVELVDLVFALDQVLVAVAMTDKIPLIIVASLAAILMLRLSATYMIRLMAWFPPLERLAYVAVGFVGLKLLVVEAVHYAGYPEFQLPKLVSVAVTLGLLVVPILGKVILQVLRKSSPKP
jgi:YkoY family integral membrane protein